MDIKEAVNKVIANLLSNDNYLIKQANSDLLELQKNPNALLALCELACTSQDESVRHYAAVLLNKRIEKLRNWQQVPAEQQAVMKQSVLLRIFEEPQRGARTALARLIGSMIRHDGDSVAYMNEIMGLVYQHCRSADVSQSELGSSILATLTDASPEQFVPHVQAICELLTEVLNTCNQKVNAEGSTALANIIVASTYLVPFSSGDKKAEQCLASAIPLVVQALNGLARLEDSHAFVEAFDFLDGCAEYHPKLLSNHFNLLMEFSIALSSEKSLDSAVRVLTILYISKLVRLKKKMVAKQNILPTIIQVLFEVICNEPDAEDTDNFFFGDDSNSPMAAATQALDILALALPPSKLIPTLLQLLEGALRSEDPLRRRAAYLSMAVISEGCADTIRSKYLENMLSIVRQGITDTSIVVRNSAFFTLGQFAEHLQPAISKYAADILPVMFEFLHQLNVEVQNNQPEPKYLDRMFYALDSFCDNAEDDLAPLLPTLMERLFALLDPKHSVHVRDLVLTTIGSVATSCKEQLQPYFEQTISALRLFLIDTDNEDLVSLRTQAIDTLAAVARSIGKDAFKPLAEESMSFALRVLEKENADEDDPDERRAVYNLIGALALVVNEEMAPIFPRIIPRLIKSVLYEDQMILNVEDEEDGDDKPIVENGGEINIEDTDEEGDDDDEDDLDIENDYMDEKEEAILTLREFAVHTGPAFLQHLQFAFENVFKMLDHLHDSIRKSSVEALVSFVIALFKQQDVSSASQACNALIPKLIKMGQEDDESAVVMEILECLGELMRELRGYSFPNEELREKVFELMIATFNGKVVCFEQDDNDDADDEASEDGDDAEIHEAVIETAGNALTDFAKTVPAERFAGYFERFLPLLLAKLKKAKRDEIYEEQRSFVYGVLAECFRDLQKMCGHFFNHLCPVLIDGMKDVSHLSRQNAYFGIGELALQSEATAYAAYPEILNALSNAMAKETELSAIDNICGAVARLIIANHTLVPLPQVLPALMQKLPLREDFTENETLIKCFNVLYAQARPTIGEHIPHIVSVTIHMLYHNQLAELPDSVTAANALIKDIRLTYPAEFQAIANSNPEVQEFATKVPIN